MRICISTGVLPPDMSGLATYVPTIGAALTEHGHHVSVITLSNVPSAGEDGYPFAVRRVCRAQPRWRRLPQVADVIAQSARRADLIYANGLFFESAWAARWTHKPLVCKVVGDKAWQHTVGRGWVGEAIVEFQRRQHRPRVEAVKRLRALAIQQADLVLTPSRYLRRLVIGWGVKPERVQVVYNALQPAPAQEPAPLPPFAGSTAITVGQLVPWKGIDGLLRVVAGLPQMRLVVVGDGPERARLESLAAGLGLGERAIFTGRVPKGQVPAYLCAADVFVLNSTYEGLPHIVLEAMHASTPVIATDVGGTGEVVRNGVNGLLIRPYDDAGLRAALQRLLRSPFRRARLTERGHRTVEEDFSLATMVSRTEALLLGAGAIGAEPTPLRGAQ